MSRHSPPYERLREFIGLLGLADRDVPPLSRWSDALLPHADTFAGLTRDFVLDRPLLRVIMENLPPPFSLMDNWRNWYAMIVSTGPSDTLLDRLWCSGQAHVTHNVDHRYVSLAYHGARGFLHRTILEAVPEPDRHLAMGIADKMIDLSLMVETDAFVTSTATCELAVIQGVSHQVRNPVTVIGGFAHRLLKNHAEDAQVRQAAQAILEEATRLERMAREVNAFLDVAEGEPVRRPVLLAHLLEQARARVLAATDGAEPALSLATGPAGLLLAGDPDELTALFEGLIGNALASADVDTPRVSIMVEADPGFDDHVVVRIVNNGRAVDAKTLPLAFSPFHADEPMEAGFTLPTARVIADRHFGNVTLAAAEPHGLKFLVTLPVFDGAWNHDRA